MFLDCGWGSNAKDANVNRLVVKSTYTFFLIITPHNHIYSSRRTSCSVLEQTQPSCFTPQSKKSILVETDQRLTSTEDVLRLNLSSSCRTNIKLHEVFPASGGTIYRLTIYGHRRRSWPVQHSCVLAAAWLRTAKLSERRRTQTPPCSNTERELCTFCSQ